jgi:hypothetical protein
MNVPWKVTHDPLGLTAARAAFAAMEEDARELGEDIIQAERLLSKKKKEILDLGWYQDRYLIFLVEEADWESPIQKIECRDLDSAMAIFHKFYV